MNITLDPVARRAGFGPLAKPLLASIDTIARGIDNRSLRLRGAGPGTLFANLHVVAEKPR